MGLCIPMSSSQDPPEEPVTPVVIFRPEPVDTSFTVEDPCLTVSCALRQMSLDAGSAQLSMDFYSNYDFLQEDAAWGEIQSAVIVVHGNNRNGSEYFSWLANALTSISQERNTLLIAPQFKTSDDVASGSDEVIFSSNGWKRGFQSLNLTSGKLASYDIIDSVMSMLANKDRFPFLEKIVVTGHSAGAQFTNLYAAANPMDGVLEGVEIEDLVESSQFFF